MATDVAEHLFGFLGGAGRPGVGGFSPEGFDLLVALHKFESKGFHHGPKVGQGEVVGVRNVEIASERAVIVKRPQCAGDFDIQISSLRDQRSPKPQGFQGIKGVLQHVRPDHEIGGGVGLQNARVAFEHREPSGSAARQILGPEVATEAFRLLHERHQRPAGPASDIEDRTHRAGQIGANLGPMRGLLLEESLRRLGFTQIKRAVIIPIKEGLRRRIKHRRRPKQPRGRAKVCIHGQAVPIRASNGYRIFPAGSAHAVHFHPLQRASFHRRAEVRKRPLLGGIKPHRGRVCGGKDLNCREGHKVGPEYILRAMPEVMEEGSSPSPPRADPFAPFRYRDFRLLWGGALLSFMGSWVQTVAQGWLVYEITRNEEKLAWIAFASMIPVSIFGPFAGALVDTLNRRAVLVWCQIVFLFGAVFLAAANHFGFVRYEQILLIALLNGFASTLEMPARQSLISTVVPADVVASAVPIQASTFNLARVIGPAIGGFLLARFGPQSCYLVNALSYSGLIFGVLAIRANLMPLARERQPIYDLMVEGIRYTLRHRTLKPLFYMEATVSVFGLAYLPLLPAFARDVLGLDRAGLGWIYTCIGIGAISGLAFLILTAHLSWKGNVVRIAMSLFAVALLGLSFTQQFWAAAPFLVLLGMGSIVQFNTTNTLFQSIAPPELRGRVIAMHVWALSGSAPIALPAFGWLSRTTSVPVSMQVGAAVVGIGALFAWLRAGHLASLEF